MTIWILVIKKTNLENNSYQYPSFYLPIATCWNNAQNYRLYYILWFMKKMFIQKYMQYGTQRENMCTEVIVENPQIEFYTLLENVSLV